jgi:hypothetical protein
MEAMTRKIALITGGTAEETSVKEFFTNFDRIDHLLYLSFNPLYL